MRRIRSSGLDDAEMWCPRRSPHPVATLQAGAPCVVWARGDRRRMRVVISDVRWSVVPVDSVEFEAFECMNPFEQHRHSAEGIEATMVQSDVALELLA